MIPLRVLHFVDPNASASTAGAEVLATWLVRDGHAAAIAVPEGTELLPVPNVDIIEYSEGVLASLFGAKTDFARRIALWTPDIIHAHDLSVVPAALDLARRLSMSLVASIHDLEDSSATRILHDAKISWILVPSERHRAHYVGKIGLARDRVSILPCGVDVAGAASCSYRISDGDTVIGFAGTCENKARTTAFFAALSEISKSQRVRALFRPNKPGDAAALQELLAASAASALVSIDTSPTTVQFMSRIDAFADLDDNDNDDGAALMLLQAMACARAVLAMAVGDRPELVRDGETAVLAAPERDDALLSGLRQLCDPQRRRELGEAGRALASKRFDISIIGEAAVELYRSALGGTKNASAHAETSTIYRRISETRLK